jgi:uncharacterized cupredoxin-like copper-binding protein
MEDRRRDDLVDVDLSQARDRARPRLRLIGAPTALLCVGLMLLASGCGGGSHSSPGGTVVGITERDFHISATTAQVSAGDVTLRVHNTGPDEHELIVVPLQKGGLPIRPDGFTVNEEALQRAEPGSLTPGEPGSTRLLRVHLAPGRYVFFCNMEGHYMGGMHTVLAVTS